MWTTLLQDPRVSCYELVNSSDPPCEVNAEKSKRKITSNTPKKTSLRCLLDSCTTLSLLVEDRADADADLLF